MTETLLYAPLCARYFFLLAETARVRKRKKPKVFVIELLTTVYALWQCVYRFWLLFRFKWIQNVDNFTSLQCQKSRIRAVSNIFDTEISFLLLVLSLSHREFKWNQQNWFAIHTNSHTHRDSRKKANRPKSNLN